MPEICVNKVIYDYSTAAEYLVLWVADYSGYGYWYDLASKYKRPARFEMNDVYDKLADSRYGMAQYTPPNTPRPEETLTNAERKRRDRLWGVIQSVVEAEPEIYDVKSRPRILRETAALYGIAPKNLYVLLDRYWKSGKTKNAFIPNYTRCGAKGATREEYRKAETENTPKANVAGKTLAEADRKNFAAAIRRYYLIREKPSLKWAYEKLLQDFYTVPDIT